MSDDATHAKFPKGTPVEPNASFRVQFPGSKVSHGIIVGYPHFGRGVKVKWFERKTPQSLHIDYLRVVRSRS